MVNCSDFTNGQETKSTAALPYDFFKHVVQQNKRDDDSRMEYHAPKMRLHATAHPEACERCRKNLGHVYIWNGKRLCQSCMEVEQDAWVLFTGGPNSAAQRVSVRPLKKPRERSLIESLISEFLALLGLQRIEKETCIAEPKMPMELARPREVQRPDKKQMPEAEGIMKRKKKKKA